MSFASLGPHGGYILAAYLVSGLIVAALILRAIVDGRAQRRALAAIEGEGRQHLRAGSGADD